MSLIINFFRAEEFQFEKFQSNGIRLRCQYLRSRLAMTYSYKIFAVGRIFCVPL